MATTAGNNWIESLQAQGVAFKQPPFGLPSAPKSTEANLVELQKDYRNFVTPSDYNDFVTQVGPGTLGRVRIYGYEARIDFLAPLWSCLSFDVLIA